MRFLYPFLLLILLPLVSSITIEAGTEFSHGNVTYIFNQEVDDIQMMIIGHNWMKLDDDNFTFDSGMNQYNVTIVDYAHKDNYEFWMKGENTNVNYSIDSEGFPASIFLNSVNYNYNFTAPTSLTRWYYLSSFQPIDQLKIYLKFNDNLYDDQMNSEYLTNTAGDFTDYGYNMQALNFDYHSSDYITFDTTTVDLETPPVHSYSFALWLYYTNVTNYPRWVAGYARQSTTNSSAGLMIATNGSLLLNISRAYKYGQYIAPNTWNHVIVTYNTSNYATKLYVNGELDITFTNYFNAASDAYFTFGKRVTHYFDGSLDEFMYYNKTLTALEVSQLYRYYEESGRDYNIVFQGESGIRYDFNWLTNDDLHYVNHNVYNVSRTFDINKFPLVVAWNDYNQTVTIYKPQNLSENIKNWSPSSECYTKKVTVRNADEPANILVKVYSKEDNTIFRLVNGYNTNANGEVNIALKNNDIMKFVIDDEDYGNYESAPFVTSSECYVSQPIFVDLVRDDETYILGLSSTCGPHYFGNCTLTATFTEDEGTFSYNISYYNGTTWFDNVHENIDYEDGQYKLNYVTNSAYNFTIRFWTDNNALTLRHTPGYVWGTPLLDDQFDQDIINNHPIAYVIFSVIASIILAFVIEEKNPGFGIYVFGAGIALFAYFLPIMYIFVGPLFIFKVIIPLYKKLMSGDNQ